MKYRWARSIPGQEFLCKLTGAVLCLGLLLCGGTVIAVAAESEEAVLVTVNGAPITRARVQLHLQTQGVPREEWSRWEETAVEQLIERTLIQELLDSRKVTAPTATLDRQLALVERVLSKVDSPEETLAKLGMTREQLQKELALPLAWQRYARQVVTEPRMREYFEKHRQELDGTKRQAAQIFLKVPSEAAESEAASALARLQEFRQRILWEEKTFAEMAEAYSQAPSAAQGGDMGTFTFHGQMPAEIARVVFATPVGELSQPFRTRFGVHLVHVVREVPGEFSLEDVRREILDRLAQELWDQNVIRLKKSARIVRP